MYHSRVNLSDFSYDLPPELIAQNPLPVRSASRMLFVDHETGDWADRSVRDLPGLLATVPRRHQPDQSGGTLEELVGAAWLAIRSCRTERQPTHVAANIVRDASYRAFLAPARRLASPRRRRPCPARRRARRACWCSQPPPSGPAEVPRQADSTPSLPTAAVLIGFGAILLAPAAAAAPSRPPAPR